MTTHIDRPTLTDEQRQRSEKFAADLRKTVDEFTRIFNSADWTTRDSAVLKKAMVERIHTLVEESLPPLGGES